MDDTQTRLSLVSIYEQAVLEYENLDRSIRDFLSARGGRGTGDLADQAHREYRNMKDQLDIAYDNMKTLERRLLGDELL